MKKLYLRASSMDAVFFQLQHHFQGKFTKGAEEYRLEFQNNGSKGSVVGFQWEPDFSYLANNVIFAEDTEIIGITPLTNPIYYCCVNFWNY
jgi:hypothetical protein